MSLLKYISSEIKYQKNHTAWLSIVSPFNVKFIFMNENTEEGHKMAY